MSEHARKSAAEGAAALLGSSGRHMQTGTAASRSRLEADLLGVGFGNKARLIEVGRNVLRSIARRHVAATAATPELRTLTHYTDRGTRYPGGSLAQPLLRGYNKRRR
jgi:hypothetical protein